jgi:hypothetical protein
VRKGKEVESSGETDANTYPVEFGWQLRIGTGSPYAHWRVLYGVVAGNGAKLASNFRKYLFLNLARNKPSLLIGY